MTKLQKNKKFILLHNQDRTVLAYMHNHFNVPYILRSTIVNQLVQFLSVPMKHTTVIHKHINNRAEFL